MFKGSLVEKLPIYEQDRRVKLYKRVDIEELSNSSVK